MSRIQRSGWVFAGKKSLSYDVTLPETTSLHHLNCLSCPNPTRSEPKIRVWQKTGTLRIGVSKLKEESFIFLTTVGRVYSPPEPKGLYPDSPSCVGPRVVSHPHVVDGRRRDGGRRGPVTQTLTTRSTEWGVHVTSSPAFTFTIPKMSLTGFLSLVGILTYSLSQRQK